MLKLNFVFVISFLLSFPVLGAKKSISKLRDQISNQRNEVNSLVAQIKSLDSQISTNNDRYLERMKNIEFLEQKVVLLKGNLKKSALDISDDYKVSKKALDHYLIEATDTEAEDSELFKKVYLEILKKKILGLKKAQNDSNQLLDTIHIYEQKLETSKKSEETLYSLIIDLENQKKNMSKKYISVLEKKNINQGKLDKLVAKQKVYRKAKKKKSRKNKRSKGKKMAKALFKLSLPIKNFSNASKTKKGINLKYSETTPVVAPYAGEVSYAGELGSYGNVIIVDHGKEVRSVILGDLKIKVKKGDLVSADQILGYTISELGEKKNLLFQVRKKDTVQNTADWLSESNRNILKI